MNNYGYIYKTTNLLDNKIYIGQHAEKTFNPKYIGSGLYIKRAVNKYGKIHFKVELIAYASTKEELDNLEKFYIAEMRKLLSPENVYNVSIGGEGAGTGINNYMYGRTGNKNPMYGKKGKDHPAFGLKHPCSDEAKEKLRIIKLGTHLSEETRKKISLANTGEKNHMYGKRGKDCSFFGKNHTEKSKEKIRQSKIGEKNSFYGKHHSVETRARWSIIRKGRKKPSVSGINNPMFGRKHTDEAKLKMRIAIIKRNKKQSLSKSSEVQIEFAY